jgi:hypothetical protein
MKRFLWLGFVLFLYLICTGCGETFRPIIIPNPPTFPNPAAAHSVLTISDNGTAVAGSAMVIDVSGDADFSEAKVGLAPVHAAQQTANQVLVVNHSVSGMQDDSLTKLLFNGSSISTTQTLGLPANSAPNFVAVAPNDTLAYVTLPNLFLDPNHPANATVGVVNTNSFVLAFSITVGNNPYALAVTPDKSKLYVANRGDSTVSGINTVDRSSRVGSPVGTSSPPIWLVPRSDNQRVFALEANGVLAALDTTSTAGPDTLTEYSSISVPGATTMVYDSNKNRLYIPGGSVASVVDVSQAAPQVLAQLNIAPVLPSARGQGDVCSTFTPSAVNAVAVGALPDGSRAYVGAYAGFEVDVNISNATLDSDNVHTTYTYSLPPGAIDLLPGMVITISGVTSTGTPPSDFNGTFSIISVGAGTFQVANSPTDLYKSGGTGAAPNVCPQVTVVDVASNTIRSSIVIPGVPAPNPVCSSTRFRFLMAAGGDSTRAYLSSCDGGSVNIIDTSNDTYILSLQAPVGSGQPIPPATLNPPQNPVFLLAGP